MKDSAYIQLTSGMTTLVLGQLLVTLILFVQDLTVY